MKHLFIIICLLLSCGMAKAQEESYNVQRAIELIGDNNIDEAKDYLLKELQDKPKSYSANIWLGYVYRVQEDYGRALTCCNNAIKFTPKKEKESLSDAYFQRSLVQEVIGDTALAIEDLNMALKYNDSSTRAMQELGNLYYYTDKYEDANRIHNAMVKNDSGNPYPLYCLARTALNQGDIETARTLTEKAVIIDSDQSRINIMRMRIERDSKNYYGMLDFAIKALDADNNNTEAYYALMNVSDTIYESTVNRLKKEHFLNPEKEQWSYLLSHVYIRHDKYKDAIVTLKPITEGNGDLRELALYWSANCYDELYNEPMVIEMMNKAIAIDSTDAEYYSMRANAKFMLQDDLSGAEADYRKMMEKDKDYGYYAYYRIGWIREMQHRYDEALEMYNMGIALDEDYAYTYMMKGNLLKDYLGREEEGNVALQMCIDQDKGITDGTCKQYALLALGRVDEAIAVNDSILRKFDTAGNYYDAACLYSRMGKTSDAMKYLQTAFDKGYRNIRHIQRDNDMDNLRNLPEFKVLIEKYDVKDYGMKATDIDEKGLTTYEIPLRPIYGGNYKVKCVVNNLPMDFILDTGCSDVSISSVESDFMLKNGYLSQSDMRGTSRYQNANGEIHTNRTLVLREIKIGGVSLNNVHASIIKNQEAPLLLGQEVLTRFGKVEIDTKRKVLILKK